MQKELFRSTISSGNELNTDFERGGRMDPKFSDIQENIKFIKNKINEATVRSGRNESVFIWLGFHSVEQLLKQRAK